MLPTRILRASVLLAAVPVVVTAFLLIAPPERYGQRARGGDLMAFWAGGAAVASESPERLYDRRFTLAFEREVDPGEKRGYRLAYPPPVYQVAARLVSLGYPPALAATMVAMLLLTFLGAYGLARAGPPIEGLGSARTVALIAGSPAAMALAGTAQVSGAWIALLGLGLWLLAGGRRLLAGVALGFLCAKPSIAAPVFGVLLLTGRFRATAGFVLGGAALLAVSVAADGLVLWRAWFDMHAGTDGFARRMWMFPHRQITLRSGLALGAARRSPEAVLLGHVGVALGACLFFVVAAAARRAARDPLAVALGFGATLSAALLATPHLFDYDVVLHAPGWIASAAWIARGRARRPRSGKVLLFGAWVAPALTWVAAATHLHVGVWCTAAWVIWMLLELRGDCNFRGGPASATLEYDGGGGRNGGEGASW